MKRYLFNISLLMLVGLVSIIDTQAAMQNKVISKTFTITPSTEIELENKFGKIHVNTWDKNEVKANIEIHVDNGKHYDAILNSINIEFEYQAGGSYLGISTSLDDMRNNSSFSINYTVNVPKKNKLSIKNKFGDVYLADRTGDLFLELAYGQLKAEHLEGNCQIEFEFGSGMSQIASIGKGMLEIKYSKLTIEKAGPLQIDAQFSDIYGGDFSTVNVNMKYGKLVTNSIGHVRGDQSFSHFETGMLVGNIDLDCKHNHVRIDKVGAGVKEILIDGKFSKMDVSIGSNQQFEFDLHFKFADLKTRGGQITFDYIHTDKTERSYKGYLGSKTNGGLFKVDSEYGDLVLSIN